MPGKVLVCGSRTWTNKQMIKDRLSEFSEDTIIIQGCAQGADILAGVSALELGLDVKSFPADWKQYGCKAGPIRNLTMLDQKPDLVLAFQIGKSRGTQHTIDHAKKRGITVLVFNDA